VGIKLSEIQEATAKALIEASSSFRPDQIQAYERAIAQETEQNAKWILEMTLENAIIAKKKNLPLCDDTGIPHVLLEIGDDAEVEGNLGKVLEVVGDGVAEGLRALPGRPMAVRGGDQERLAQTNGLYVDSGMLIPAPIRVKTIKGKQVRVIVLMQGGGPEIRSRTYRVFHHHDSHHVGQEIANWAVEMVGLLGCTPCVPAVGIGRTHYEATCLMLDAMAYKSFGDENEMEAFITAKINETFTGPLGIGGSVTALNTFVEIGPQRASGVRIVCLRMGCNIDPRRSSIILG
jgi:fumarate hydratase subunit alpha